jgi:hypothetical protein
LEETSTRCAALSQLLVFQPGLDTLRNPTYVFSCREFEEMTTDAVHSDEVECIDWIGLADCLAMIRDGRIVDSLSIIGLLYYAQFVQRM